MVRKIDFSKIRKINLKDIKKEEIERKFRKALYSPYFYLVLGLFIGLLITVQFRTQASRPLNPIAFYNQLSDVKNEYSTKKESLSKQVKELQKQINDKQNSLSDKNTVVLFNSINEQELIFGANSINGEGVIVTISDGPNQIKDDFSKSLTHAADLRDIVNLLWYAGSEGISINGERIIYDTSIDCVVSTIMINDGNYVPPFTIKAIGNKKDLYDTLNNSRKLIDIKKRADKKQINFDLQMQNDIKIEKYSGAIPKIN
ncbi:MAG TPA: DUF881 domain-containing protein [Patescibacteria group bacterium]|nr:DUF881 domain-containing protein [Patescibacteria group bacterium]